MKHGPVKPDSRVDPFESETVAGVQGVFDFETGNRNGYENWQRERERKVETVRRTWQLPVGRRVRVKLRNIDQEFTGILLLAESPAVIAPHAPLHLRVEPVDFFVPDIEFCVVINP